MLTRCDDSVTKVIITCTALSLNTNPIWGATAPVLDVLEDSGRFLDSATSEKRVESKESKSRILL